MNQDLVLAFFVYLAAAYVLMSFVTEPRWRDAIFAVLNVAGCGAAFFWGKDGLKWQSASVAAGLVLLAYGALRLSVRFPRLYLPALFLPVAGLVLVKADTLPAVIGISYMAFRLSYTVYEVRGGKAPLPSLIGYLGFAFFPLTFLIGPINPYSRHERSLHGSTERAPLARSFFRIFIGALKCLVLGEVMRQLTFKALWFDGFEHDWGDFAIACVASYLNLYLNFSGACDMIIGAASLLEINVKENFANPLAARNIREFWSRFHISLTDYMRDIVFQPSVLGLSRRLGARWVPLVTAVMLLVNFFLVVIWHGTGKSFVVLGLLHGVAMTIFYLYALVLKKMPKALQRAAASWQARVVSTALTFAFISFTSIFFENDWERVETIFASLVAPKT